MSAYRTLTLQGDHHTMGLQHGRQVQDLRPLIGQAMESRFRQIAEDGQDAQFEELVLQTAELLHRVDAPLQDMVRGQAEALAFEFETLLRYSLVSYLRDDLLTRRPAPDGCTTWAATGSAAAERQPILAKNRDYRPEHLPLQIVARATPSTGYRYVYSGSAGSPGVFSAGINQAGLAVADTHVSSTDLGPGLPDFSLMMHILEQHDSVAAALDYLRAVPRLGRNNLVLADAGGHLAVFEIGHRAYGQRETADGVLVNTNHFVSPEMEAAFVEIEPAGAQGSSFARHRKTAGALEAGWGWIDVPFAQRLMASHDGPLASLCRHPEEGLEVTTVSTSIFLPARRLMLFCHGLPCRGRYDEFRLDRGEQE
jgi:isopenicillin-N N-acyltransferase-like protein